MAILQHLNFDSPHWILYPEMYFDHICFKRDFTHSSIFKITTENMN